MKWRWYVELAAKKDQEHRCRVLSLLDGCNWDQARRKAEREAQRIAEELKLDIIEWPSPAQPDTAGDFAVFEKGTGRSVAYVGWEPLPDQVHPPATAAT